MQTRVYAFNSSPRFSLVYALNMLFIVQWSTTGCKGCTNNTNIC